jgi:hypothetical protein
MANYKDLAEIVRMAVRIEKKMKDFYDVAEYAVHSPESKAAIAVIKSKLAEKLAILETVSPEKYGTLEWLKFAPPLEEKDVVPKNRITRASSPMDIFMQVLASEEKLKEYYTKVSAQVTARSQKELFDSLASFKNEQVEEVRRLMSIQGT